MDKKKLKHAVKILNKKNTREDSRVRKMFARVHLAYGKIFRRQDLMYKLTSTDTRFEKD